MKSVKVLGSGCKKCRLTVDSISAAAKKLGVEIEIEKVEDFAQIAGYGVIATPSVVVDGVVVHSGSVPTAEMIESWIR